MAQTLNLPDVSGIRNMKASQSKLFSHGDFTLLVVLYHAICPYLPCPIALTRASGVILNHLTLERLSE
jgi:hypothetical protein